MPWLALMTAATTIPVVLMGVVLAPRAGSPFVELRVPTGPVPIGPDAYLVSFSVVTLYLATVALPAAVALTHAIEDRSVDVPASVVGGAVYLVALAVSFGIGITGFAPEPILEFYAGYPARWGIYVWTLAVPLSLATAVASPSISSIQPLPSR